MTAPDHRQHLVIETPENVVLDYELGGLGSRTLALLIDMVILAAAWTVIVPIGLMRLAGLGGGVFGALLVILTFFSVTLYFTAFEGWRNGSTPGKRMVGIRVIRDTGHSVTFGEAIVRNLFRTIDIAFTGVPLIALGSKGKRLGDIVAGTVVVRDRPTVAIATPGAPEEHADSSAVGVPVLADPQYRLLREFIRRAPQLPPAAREEWATRLATQLDPAGRHDDRLDWLARLYRSETALRRGTGSARGSGTWERLVARKGSRWDEFQPMADRVARAGLGVLSAGELVDFAARYRELSSDLARARTYGAEPSAVLRLERLVAAGHNALYSSRRAGTWRRLWRFLLEDSPAEVVRSSALIGVAFLVFLAAGFAGYASVREQPMLAQQLLPDVMLERAAAGEVREAAGLGYFVAEARERPTMAAMLFLNNFRVCLMTFSSGIALGIGSFVIIALNGAMLGTVTGHFTNAGLTGYLLSFIAAHGPLELTAIWISGAAGFLLGTAILRPGRRTRQAALVAAGRRALRLLGAAGPFVVVAALIEGLLSAGEQSLGMRILAAVLSAASMGAYFLQGTRVLRNRPLPD